MTLPTQHLFSGTEENASVALLKQHFPQCFDKKGQFLPEKMAELMPSMGINVSREAYTLNWLGKSYARYLRDCPPTTLLNEDVAHNQLAQNQNSQNLLIKGDNLEVLKHLKNAYANQVKMIYIDPPYNTGSDGFVYQDDRQFSPKQLANLANMSLEEATRVLSFTAKKSNSHSAWLTFMYPRLYIARELLRDDGVIFISIDENEQAQLKLLCDEVFGEGNFIEQLTREAIKGGSLSRHIRSTHDYILCFAKNIDFVFFTGFEKETLELNLIDEKGAYAKGRELNKWGAGSRREDSPGMWFPIKGPNGENVYPIRNDGSEGRWRMGKQKMAELVEKNEVIFEQRSNGTYIVYEKLRGDKSKYTQMISILKDKYTNANASETLKNLFQSERAIFEFSKPYPLISDLIQISESEIEREIKDSIILDFFAGSGTTAHSVMQLNAEDGGNRKFICVQLPEETDKKSEAYKAGYQTIFDITKARIEKSAVKIRQDFPDFSGDFGFKIFETVPDFRAIQQLESELHPQMALPETFDAVLSDDQYHILLTTWRVFDGNALTEPVQAVSLGGFFAKLAGKVLYILNVGFDSSAIKALIEKLDNDKDFEPERIVLFGANVESAKQKELKQALDSYTNRKKLDIPLLVRY